MNVDLCSCGVDSFVGTFRTPSEYKALLDTIERSGCLSEVPVSQAYDNVGSKERWFACAKCGRHWRLVDPDPPFTGIWQEVLK